MGRISEFVGAPFRKASDIYSNLTEHQSPRETATSVLMSLNPLSGLANDVLGNTSHRFYSSFVPDKYDKMKVEQAVKQNKAKITTATNAVQKSTIKQINTLEDMRRLQEKSANIQTSTYQATASIAQNQYWIAKNTESVAKSSQQQVKHSMDTLKLLKWGVPALIGSIGAATFAIKYLKHRGDGSVREGVKDLFNVGSNKDMLYGTKRTSKLGALDQVQKWTEQFIYKHSAIKPWMLHPVQRAKRKIMSPLDWYFNPGMYSWKNLHDIRTGKKQSDFVRDKAISNIVSNDQFDLKNDINDVWQKYREYSKIHPGASRFEFEKTLNSKEKNALRAGLSRSSLRGAMNDKEKYWSRIYNTANKHGHNEYFINRQIQDALDASKNRINKYKGKMTPEIAAQIYRSALKSNVGLGNSYMERTNLEWDTFMKNKGILTKDELREKNINISKYYNQKDIKTLISDFQNSALPRSYQDVVARIVEFRLNKEIGKIKDRGGEVDDKVIKNKRKEIELQTKQMKLSEMITKTEINGLDKIKLKTMSAVNFLQSKGVAPNLLNMVGGGIFGNGLLNSIAQPMALGAAWKTGNYKNVVTQLMMRYIPMTRKPMMVMGAMGLRKHLLETGLPAADNFIKDALIRTIENANEHKKGTAEYANVQKEIENIKNNKGNYKKLKDFTGKTLKGVSSSPMSQYMIDRLAQNNMGAALAIQIGSGKYLGALRTALSTNKYLGPIIHAYDIANAVVHATATLGLTLAGSVKNAIVKPFKVLWKLSSSPEYRKIAKDKIGNFFTKSIPNYFKEFAGGLSLLHPVKSLGHIIKMTAGKGLGAILKPTVTGVGKFLTRFGAKLFGIPYPFPGFDTNQNLALGQMITTGDVLKTLTHDGIEFSKGTWNGLKEMLGMSTSSNPTEQNPLEKAYDSTRNAIRVTLKKASSFAKGEEAEETMPGLKDTHSDIKGVDKVVSKNGKINYSAIPSGLSTQEKISFVQAGIEDAKLRNDKKHHQGIFGFIKKVGGYIGKMGSWIYGIIGALLGGGTGLIKNGFGKIGGKLGDAFNWAKTKLGYGAKAGTLVEDSGDIAEGGLAAAGGGLLGGGLGKVILSKLPLIGGLVSAGFGIANVIGAIKKGHGGLGLVSNLLGGSNKGGLGSGVSGALSGGAMGMAVGSVVPVIGTLLGGIVGTAVGGIVGAIGGKRINEAVTFVKDKTEWIGSELWRGIKSIGNGIASAIGWFWNKLKSIIPAPFKHFFNFVSGNKPSSTNVNTEPVKAQLPTAANEKDEIQYVRHTEEHYKKLKTVFTESLNEYHKKHSKSLSTGNILLDFLNNGGNQQSNNNEYNNNIPNILRGAQTGTP